ncbi:MAG: DUF3298 and DUF4163 domain-containing protein [Lachnospiraceae bacterium]|nr:DUF3298 and DUF4163 domain-containing protein [Lachnospiraceae bacterium]
MKRKKKSLTLQTSTALLAALLAVSLSACGTGSKSDTNVGQEISNGADVTGSDHAQTESSENDTEPTQPEDASNDAANNAGNSDTSVTNNPSETDTSKVTVTIQETIDEIKADDGKVIFTNSVELPVVSIEDAPEIAAKINADLEAYYQSFSTDKNSLVETAKEDYAASLGEDGWDFLGYSTMANTKVTRADDAVISFQITIYDYTGGAHGNYGSGGRNYSAKTGELLTFNEISEDYEAFHATVLDYMINLADTSTYQDKLFGPPSKDDLDSALFNGDNWVFTKSGISFFAAPYLLGPYASGEIAFMLPYEKAYDLGLKEELRYSGNFVDERYYIYKCDPDTFEPIVDDEPDCYFDLDGDGTEEGLAFYGQVVDPATGESRYAFYIDGKDYGDVINDELQNINTNGYMESTYALYHADGPDGGVPAIAVLFTEFGEGEDANGDPLRYPRSYLFGYTKEKGLYYLYSEDGFVTLPNQS